MTPAPQLPGRPHSQSLWQETLNARVQFMSDESDGRTHSRINQYTILDEIGRGSYGAVHSATDQYGNEFVSSSPWTVGLQLHWSPSSPSFVCYTGLD